MDFFQKRWTFSDNRLYYPLCVSRRIDTWQIVYLSSKDPCPTIHKIEIRYINIRRATWTAMELARIQLQGMWSAVAQLVECRTRNRESPGSNPVVTVSKFGHFLSLHDASVDSAV